MAFRTCLDYRPSRDGLVQAALAATVETSVPPASTGQIVPRPPVISSETPASGSNTDLGLQAARRIPSPAMRVRHATCFGIQALKKHSHSVSGSVNSAHRSAKATAGDRDSSFRRGSDGRKVPVRRCGWNHGAAGNGYRKRTRVRVACGVTIRSRGVGIPSSHGHFGRLVGGWFLFFVVPEPVREEPLRRRHLSRGPGLPAAALTLSPVGFERLSAVADRPARATRPSSAVVSRATFAPAPTGGLSTGWRRRTRPDPRTRLRPV